MKEGSGFPCCFRGGLREVLRCVMLAETKYKTDFTCMCITPHAWHLSPAVRVPADALFLSHTPSSVKMGSGSSTCKSKAITQDLRGKHFVVTGANTGLGYATTRELAKMGAKVTLACRSADRGQQAVDKIRAEALEKPVKEVGRQTRPLPSDTCTDAFEITF